MKRDLFGHTWRLLLALPLILLATGALGFGSPADSQCQATLSDHDTAAIKAVIEVYRTAWLAGDAAGVRKTLTDDAVLLPAQGGAPLVGRAAIDKFWWPAGAPPSKVTKLNITVEEVGGSCTTAYARGRDEVSWSVEENGISKTDGNAGTYLNIMRKLPDGSWRISHHMWDSHPAPVQSK